MALFRQVFARAGAVPDLPSLITAIRPTIGDPFYIGLQVDNGVLSLVVEKPTVWIAGDVTTVQTAVTNAVDATERTSAQAWVDAMPITEKAICLAIIDQLNVLRAFHSLGAITPAAAILAIRAKAATL